MAVSYAKYPTDDNGKFISENGLKVMLYGDPVCGKTELISAMSGYFNPPPSGYPGLAIANLDYPKARLCILEAPCNEIFGTNLPSYFSGVIGVICVFDVTNEESFLNVEEKWLPKMKLYARDDEFRQVILVGTKCDLNKQRVVSGERALMVADELELKYFEVSGKTGYNVKLAITELTKDIIRMIENEAAESRR